MLALLEQLSARNSLLYAGYQGQQPTNARFLSLMGKIFDSQFDFRGVYIGNQFVQAEIQKRQSFDYKSVATRRMATFANIFRELDVAGHLAVTEADISFLVSYITLFGRFWISEATLFNKSPDKTATIRHYLLLLAKQLSLFAAEEGQKSIDEFMSDIS